MDSTNVVIAGGGGASVLLASGIANRGSGHDRAARYLQKQAAADLATEGATAFESRYFMTRQSKGPVTVVPADQWKSAGSTLDASEAAAALCRHKKVASRFTAGAAVLGVVGALALAVGVSRLVSSAAPSSEVYGDDLPDAN